MVKFVHSKPTISDEEIQIATKVLSSENLQEGEYVKELEESFKTYFKRDYAIGVSNGFSAIHLSLIALNVSKEDEVILPSYSCPALYNPIVLLGAKPILVDIEHNSFNTSYTKIKPFITTKTKAIIIPHMFGFPSEIDKIKQLGIKIIEDCAQSIGGIFNNKKLGTFGDLAVFSFYASKMITGGDGGMIITDDVQYNNTINDYKYYGHKKGHNVIAYNYHLTNLNAAIANVQFNKLSSFIDKRIFLAKEYNKNLKGLLEGLEFNNLKSAVFFRYPVKVNIEIRDLLIKEMKELGINCGVGVLDGIHELHPSNQKFPNTDELLKSIICLPIYPSLSQKDIKDISTIFLTILNKYQ